jgi:hypothetical protein
MGVSFTETMAGTWTNADGDKAPLIFTVDIFAKSPLHFLTGDAMKLEGTITAGGLCKNAPCTGQLEVRIMRERELMYYVAFEDDSGRPCTVAGTKKVSVRHLLRSMTILDVSVFQGDDKLGPGEMTFDLKHLPKFMGSFRPI